MLSIEFIGWNLMHIFDIDSFCYPKIVDGKNFRGKYPQNPDALRIQNSYMKGGTSQLLLLGKFEYGGGPIFKVVLEC